MLHCRGVNLLFSSFCVPLNRPHRLPLQALKQRQVAESDHRDDQLAVRQELLGGVVCQHFVRHGSAVGSTNRM